jgi:hypothetical protein
MLPVLRPTAGVPEAIMRRPVSRPESADFWPARAAFTVGDNTSDVIETGLYNLTKDEAPCLIHFGSERTEQWLLVRLENPNAAQQ